MPAGLGTAAAEFIQRAFHLRLWLDQCKDCFRENFATRLAPFSLVGTDVENVAWGKTPFFQVRKAGMQVGVGVLGGPGNEFPAKATQPAFQGIKQENFPKNQSEVSVKGLIYDKAAAIQIAIPSWPETGVAT